MIFFDPCWNICRNSTNFKQKYWNQSRLKWEKKWQRYTSNYKNVSKHVSVYVTAFIDLIITLCKKCQLKFFVQSIFILINVTEKVGLLFDKNWRRYLVSKLVIFSFFFFFFLPSKKDWLKKPQWSTYFIEALVLNFEVKCLGKLMLHRHRTFYV